MSLAHGDRTAGQLTVACASVPFTPGDGSAAFGQTVCSCAVGWGDRLNSLWVGGADRRRGLPQPRLSGHYPRAAKAGVRLTMTTGGRDITAELAQQMADAGLHTVSVSSR